MPAPLRVLWLDQVDTPLTVMASVPVSVPPVKFSVEIVTLEPVLKLSVPLLTDKVPSVGNVVPAPKTIVPLPF